MKTYCIYHKVDFDGKCSAAIILKKYPDAILVPYQYGDELRLDQFQDNEVIMVDCSLQPFQNMLLLGKYCKLTWIDHHKTAIEEYKKVPVESMTIEEAITCIGKAGCELTWDWAFSDIPMPEIVHLLGRYDVWDLQLDVLEFQYGMRRNSYEPDDPRWQLYFDDDLSISDILKDGKIIYEYIQTFDIMLCKSAFEADFNGLRCICLNTPGANSQVFESIWDEDKYDAMLVFYNSKNDHWKIGLYTSKESVDVGAIAKHYGGGGHKQAAGFQIKKLPEFLLSKY